MKTYDWSQFVKRIPVKATVEQVYRAWASQQGLESWFLRKAEFSTSAAQKSPADGLVQKGDRYEWLWHGWSDDVLERGDVLEANGKDSFRFTFGKAGIVNIRIQTEQNETVVELMQENIPTDEESKTLFHIGCGEGWTFYLANLKSILEGGLDLRNKNLLLTKVVNS